MKKGSVIVFLFVINSFCNAQNYNRIEDVVYRQHRGFFLSMSIGPNFPSITSEVVGVSKYNFSGVGAQFDFKIGGAIKENLILHASLTSNTLSGPQITSDNFNQNASNDVTLGEAFIGGGLTYYLMPVNISFSGSLGIGNFTLVDNDNSISTDRGFSMQLKAGKEWWISKRWGLGFALTYGKSKLTNTPGGSAEELLNSNNFGILFNATLN